MSSKQFSFQQRARAPSITSPSVSAATSIAESFSLTEVKSPRSQTKYYLDYQLICQKISDLCGDSSSSVSNTPLPSPKSSMVSLRAAPSLDPNEDKVTQQQKVLDKIAELDRIVLKKTAYADHSGGMHTQLASARRKQGSDLLTIPTHMQILDRLLDFHSQIWRPNIDHSELSLPNIPRSGKNPSGKQRSNNSLLVIGESTGSPRIQSENQHSKGDHSTKSHEDFEAKCRELEAENTKLKKKVQSLTTEVSALKDKNATQQQEKTVSIQNQEEIQSLRAELHSAREQQDRYLSSINAMLTKKAVIVGGGFRKDGVNASYEMNYNNYHLTHDIRETMISLDNALSKRFEDVYKEIDDLRQAKSIIEAQLHQHHESQIVETSNQSNLEKEHIALKEAFENLKAESAEALKNCVTSCNQKVFLLHDELRDCRMKISSLEILNEEVSQMNSRLLIAEQEKISNATLIKQLRDEIEAYQRLNDSLKEKIRNMNTSDGKEFLDTFEEVMRSEMMTMKSAFEAKLKAAREEADALSKRHLAEIARMKQSNLPTALLQQKSLSEKNTVQK